MAEESVAASGLRWRARRVEFVETLVETDVLMMSLSYQLSHKHSAVTPASLVTQQSHLPQQILTCDAHPTKLFGHRSYFYSVIPVALLIVHAYSNAVCFHLP